MYRHPLYARRVRAPRAAAPFANRVRRYNRNTRSLASIALLYALSYFSTRTHVVHERQNSRKLPASSRDRAVICIDSTEKVSDQG